MIKKCKICLKVFYPRPAHVRVGWGKYCSPKCHHLSMRVGKMVRCDQCNIDVYKNNTKLTHSKSGKYFCSKSCQTRWRNKYFSGNKHANWIRGESTYRKVLIGSRVDHVCVRCRNNDSRILVAHHIDHNRKNYDVKNLMWLCRNCHFFIHYDKLEEEKLLKNIGIN